MNYNNLTRDIQNKALEILEEFKKICKKYNLTYMAIGGTCLGANRHHGFIHGMMILMLSCHRMIIEDS